MRLSKPFIVALCLVFALAPQAKGQEVFNQVVASAKNIIDDPRPDPFLLNIAQFKYTAMQYLCNTAIRRNGGGVDADLLDRQAYSMNHFVTSYFSEMAKLQNSGEAKQKDMMKRYWKATADNPMFNDPDKETTDAFIDAPDCITPFSLDTDWEKADEAISRKE